VRLKLDANEGPPLRLEWLLEELQRAGSEVARRYPDAQELEARLAARFDVEPDRVLVTAGADEALDRCCRAFLSPGRTLLVAEPTFEMLPLYTRLSGGELVGVPWGTGVFPIQDLLSTVDQRTAIIGIVSPNNPTGEVASRSELERLASAAPHALVLLDHVYAEYADDDLTGAALRLPNVVTVRTFSKAWGLAGCRVGYAVGPRAVIDALRAAGGPYPVAGLSLALAAARMEQGGAELAAHVDRIRLERGRLTTLFSGWGRTPRQSQANFVFVDFGSDAARVQAALAADGILVRGFPGRPGVETCLRITLPGDPDAFAELGAALERILTSRVTA
jgi:histidinol-phosphate aminotransferase